MPLNKSMINSAGGLVSYVCGGLTGATIASVQLVTRLQVWPCLYLSSPASWRVMSQYLYKCSSHHWKDSGFGRRCGRGCLSQHCVAQEVDQILQPSKLESGPSGLEVHTTWTFSRWISSRMLSVQDLLSALLHFSAVNFISCAFSTCRAF